MPNVNVSLAKDSHMAFPGVVMGGDSQGHNYQGFFVSGGPPKFNLPYNTKVIYREVACQNLYFCTAKI